MIRKPIVTVVGHVDHGKTSLLDAVRSSTVTEREAGKITQAIGASIIPIETLKRVCGNLLKQELSIPGLLFIDTPGHAAFSTLRKRGGNLADIAILVIDINEGFMPQTEEAIEILKAAKTPFIIAANKVDLSKGWKSDKSNLIQNINSLDSVSSQIFENKMYELVGNLYEKFQISAERFDRVDDYSKQVAIVPISALTKQGLPELFMVLIGLVHKYLESGLEIDEVGDAKGTILEVKDQKGMGTALDVILYDGVLKAGDVVFIGGIGGAIKTKVRALFEPKCHCEMMDVKGRYCSVKEAVAATGVRIIAPDTDYVIAGMPVQSCRSNSNAESEVQAQIKEVLIETDKEGIVIKADTIGSLEALITLLRDKKVSIRKATIGDINKKDLADAESNYEKNKFDSVVLAFNVKGKSTDKVKVISSNIIYKVIEEYELWIETMKKVEEDEELDKLVLPVKFEIMKGHIFRQSCPAVVGVSIEQGTLKTGMQVMNKQGKKISTCKGLQSEQKSISKAEKGKQVACSLDSVVVGRQIEECQILYSDIPEQDFIKLKELKHLLSKEDLSVMKEIAEIKRENNPVWGI